MFSFFLGRNLEAAFLVHILSVVQLFSETTEKFSKAQFYTPRASLPCQSGIDSLLILAVPGGIRCYHTVLSICIFLMTEDVGNLFMCLLATCMSSLFFKKILFTYFRQRAREGEREGEKCVVASHTPPTEDLTWPATQACALTGNRTKESLVCKSVLNPLSTPARAVYLL